MTVANNALERLIAKAGPLYSLPAVAMQAVTLLDNTSVDTRALKECIEHDPALTGKILRVVNSPLYGLNRQVSDLNQAIALLGIKPLKLLVLGFSLPPGLFEGPSPWVLEWYWRHALTKAAAARLLSQRIWRRPGDEAFLAGLLQDVGVLVLAAELGEPYLRLLESAACGGDLRAAERNALGLDHVEVSRGLLRSWGLPPALYPADPTEDSPSPDTRGALGEIVLMAEHAARWIADGQLAALRLLLAGNALQRPLDHAEIEELLRELDAAMLPLADVFHLPAFSGDRARELIVRAHAQLSQVAAEAAEELLRPAHEPIDLPAEIACIRELAAQLVRPSVPTATSRAAATLPVDRHAAVAVEVPELVARLRTAVAAARHERVPLSLLLVSIDLEDEASDSRPSAEPFSITAILEAACRQIDQPGMACVALGEGHCGVILPDSTRREAIELAGDWLDSAHRAASLYGDADRLRFAAGVATVASVSKNFPAEELYSAASRCLYASNAAGAGAAKSIEL